MTDPRRSRVDQIQRIRDALVQWRKRVVASGQIVDAKRFVAEIDPRGVSSRVGNILGLVFGYFAEWVVVATVVVVLSAIVVFFWWAS